MEVTSAESTRPAESAKVMLQQNLLYTGWTAASEGVALVGQKKAIALAPRNFRAGGIGETE